MSPGESKNAPNLHVGSVLRLHVGMRTGCSEGSRSFASLHNVCLLLRANTESLFEKLKKQLSWSAGSWNYLGAHQILCHLSNSNLGPVPIMPLLLLTISVLFFKISNSNFLTFVWGSNHWIQLSSSMQERKTTKRRKHLPLDKRDSPPLGPLLTNAWVILSQRARPKSC